MSRGPKVIMELQRVSESDDGGGGFTEEWSGIRNIKGTLLALASDERIGMDRETVYATHRFFCDDQAGLTITEKWRLRLGIRIFKIEYVNRATERKNKHLEIDLLEIT